MRFGIAVIDGCFSSGIASLLDILNTAESQRKAFDPSIPPIRAEVMASKRRVRTVSGMLVPATASLGELADADMAVVCAFGTITPQSAIDRLESADGRAMIKAIGELGDRPVAAAGTGTYVLAEAGRLDFKRATTSWWLRNSFQRRYPSVTLDMSSMVVTDGNAITAGAAFAHVDLGLALVATLSPELAHRVARMLVIDERRPHSPYMAVCQADEHDPLVLEFERYVRAHLSDDLAVATAAVAIGTTRRTLERRIRESLGVSPLEFIQKIRIERSRYLMATTTLNVDQVANEVGYQNGSTLRALLRRAV